MATVDITLATVNGRAQTGSTMPVPDTAQVDSDLITSSGTSQQSDFTVPAAPASGATYFWVITVTGGAIRAMFGTNPTAVAAEAGGWLILAETTRVFAATPGDKCAVITA